MTECNAKGIFYFQMYPLCVVHIYQVVLLCICLAFKQNISEAITQHQYTL